VSMEDFRQAIARRQSSLAPWFKQAAEQLKAGGEEQTYPELAELVAKNRQTAPKKTREELDAMKKEKAEAEFMLEEAKNKYRGGELDEETLKYMAKECQRKIIHLEVEIKMAEGKKES